MVGRKVDIETGDAVFSVVYSNCKYNSVKKNPKQVAFFQIRFLSVQKQLLNTSSALREKRTVVLRNQITLSFAPLLKFY